MFQIKLTARPDARMVEVPLDIEVELPREFDGAAVLVSSGMPRKVRLRTPRDTIKLSTAYRIDQLVADLARTILRGAQQDVAKVQEAAAIYLKLARERRQEGATFLIESDGRGRVQVVEQAPSMPVSPSFRSSSGMSASQQLAGTMNDRIAAVERALALLEAKVGAANPTEVNEKLVRGVSEQLERKLDQRLADLEEQLAAAHRGEQLGRPLTRTSQALPTPGASRSGMRRSTAVEAFADGLRSELKLRVRSLMQAAQERAALCDKCAQIAVEAERAGGPKVDAAAALLKLTAEAGARATALSRISEEVDLYSPADIPLASQLLDRLSRTEPVDPIPLLRSVTEEGWLLGTLQLPWLTRAAQVAGWKVIAPQSGDPFESALHEHEGQKGDVVDSLLQPGVHDRNGTMLLHARVLLRPLQTLSADDELPVLDPEPVSEPVSASVAEISAPILDETSLSQPISGPILDEASISQPISAPISAPIIEEIFSAPIIEELPADGSQSSAAPGSGPIDSGPIISAQIVSAPIISAPIVSAPIISEPIISEPIISAPIDPEPGSSNQSSFDPISAPILEEELIQQAPAAPAPDAAAPPDAAPPDSDAAPREANATPIEAAATNRSATPRAAPHDHDDDWERVGRGPSAFPSNEGKPHSAEPKPADEPQPDTPLHKS